jgi:hypothetical protein
VRYGVSKSGGAQPKGSDRVLRRQSSVRSFPRSPHGEDDAREKGSRLREKRAQIQGRRGSGAVRNLNKLGGVRKEKAVACGQGAGARLLECVQVAQEGRTAGLSTSRTMKPSASVEMTGQGYGEQ